MPVRMPQPVVGDYPVYISYRRKSGDMLASLVYWYLKCKKMKPFLDVVDLSPGSTMQNLMDIRRMCQVQVIILTKGNHIKDDFFEQDIRWGIECGKNIVAVYEKGVDWVNLLPPGLTDKQIKDISAVRYENATQRASLSKLQFLIKSHIDMEL